jgi:hypothetical protein
MWMILASLLPLLLVLIVFRIGIRALRPLLADVRAGAGRQQRLVHQRSRAHVSADVRRGLIQVAVVGGATTAIYVFMERSNLLQSPPLIEFLLKYDFPYRYYPAGDFGVVAGIAIGLALFVTGWRSALAAAVSLYVLLVAWDFAFNVIGALAFPTASDFYKGGPFGEYLWVIFYAGYAAAVAGGLSVFSPRYRAFLPWATLIVTGAVSTFLANNQLAGPLLYLGIPYFLPHILIAAAAGWWMMRTQR